MYAKAAVYLCTLAFISSSSGQGVKSPTKSASQLDFVSPVSKHRQSWGVKTTESHVQAPMFQPQSAALVGGQHGYSLTIDHGLAKEPVAPLMKSNQMVAGQYDTQVVTSGEQVQPAAYISGDMGSSGWMKESTLIKERPRGLLTQQIHTYNPVYMGAMKAPQPWLYSMPMAHQYMLPMARQVQFAHYTPAMGPLVMPMAAPLGAHLAPLPHLGLQRQQFIKFAQPWSYSTWTHQPEMHVSKLVKSQVSNGGWTAPLPQQPELDTQVNMKLDRFGAGAPVPVPVGKMNFDSQNAVQMDRSFEGISQVKTD